VTVLIGHITGFTCLCIRLSVLYRLLIKGKNVLKNHNANVPRACVTCVPIFSEKGVMIKVMVLKVKCIVRWMTA